MNRGNFYSEAKPLYFAVVLAFALMLLSPFALHAAEFLTPEAAKAHVGQTATVCGPVANTYYSRFVGGKPTFINFGRPYPNHVFSIAIMGVARAKYDNAPEKVFEGRKVCVTGLIEAYDTKKTS